MILPLSEVNCHVNSEIYDNCIRTKVVFVSVKNIDTFFVYQESYMCWFFLLFSFDFIHDDLSGQDHAKMWNT